MAPVQEREATWFTTAALREPDPVEVVDPVKFTDSHAFEAFMRTAYPLGAAATLKTRRHFFHRIQRELSALDLRDIAVVSAFRETLPQGSKNIFNRTWEMLRDYAATFGITDISECPTQARIRFVHPLMPDFTTLSAYYGTDDISRLLWGDLPPAGDGATRLAARRIYEFYVGQAVPREVPAGRPVALHKGKIDAMRPWHVRAIINSGAYVTSGPLEQASEQIVSLLVHTRMHGIQLRTCMEAYVRARPRVMRHDNPKSVVTGMKALIEKNDLRGFLRQVDALSAGNSDPLPLW